MNKNMEKELIEMLNKYLNEDVIVIQEGFMQAKYVIKKFSYNIQEDVIKCMCLELNYISLNINMINGIEYIDKVLVIYSDNDTIVKIQKLG